MAAFRLLFCCLFLLTWISAISSETNPQDGIALPMKCLRFCLNGSCEFTNVHCIETQEDGRKLIEALDS